MIRALLLCLLIAAPATISAQVFPKIDPTEVEKNLDSAKTPAVETPVDTPPEPTVDPKKPVSGCYKRYVELRSGYFKTRSPEKNDVNKSVAEMPPAIEVYLRAKAYLALGFYKDAGAEASRIKTPINEPTAFNPVQEAVITELNNGGAWRLRVVAEVWEGYGDYETEEILQQKWDKAKKEAQKIITKFEEFVAAGGMTEQLGSLQKRAMQNWLDNSYAHWKNLWNARRACQERGDEIAVWENLIALTGPDRNFQNDDSPCYLDARAAMIAVKEHFGDLKRIKDGAMDIQLNRAYIGALQIELALKACAVASGMDAPTRMLMLSLRTTTENFRDGWLDDLKWK